jgi:iron(III) transport system substrate-binding protein
MRLACCACSLLVAAAPALAYEPLPDVVEAATYKGADRTARLVAGAKKEGELILYSSLTPPDQLKLAADFKERYGVTLRFWRGSQTNILQRVMNETRGGRFDFDVLETNSPQVEALAHEKLLQKVDSPHVGEVLLPQTLPAHGEWTPDRLNLMVYAYNTNQVKPADLPKRWEELLGERWKRRIGMESTNVEWFAALVQSMGEQKGLEFFRRLGDNGIAVRTGHTHSTGLVIAGEIPLFLGVFSHDVDRMRAKAAPVDWFVLSPAVILPSAVAVSRRASHPNAAVLFYDYMLTEGQRFYTDVHRVPANKSYDTPVRRLVQEGKAVAIVDARDSVDEHDKWQALYQRLVVERSQH